MTPAEVQELFADGGSELYCIVMPDGQPREEQTSYATRVAELMTTAGAIGLFQAETGCGKTLGYLVPALLEAAAQRWRVVVSTNTLALQRQLADVAPEVLDLVAKLTGVRMTCARRVGRSNFVSIQELEARARQISDPDLKGLLAEIVAALKAAPEDATMQTVREEFGDRLAEIKADELAPRLFWDLGIGQHDGDEAGYKAMIERSHGVDLLIVNHALLGTHLTAFGSVLFEPDEDARDYVLVVDEADELPATVARILQRRVQVNELERIAKRLPKADQKLATAAIDGLKTHVENAAKRAKPTKDDKTRVLPLTSETVMLARGVREQVMDLLSVLERSGGTESADPKIKNLAYDLEAIRDNLQPVGMGADLQGGASIYWTPVKSFAGIHLDGGNPAFAINKLWREPNNPRPNAKRRPQRILFTSATLTGNPVVDEHGETGRMKDFAREIGLFAPHLDAPSTVRAHFAPREFGAMDFVVVDQRVAPVITRVQLDVPADQEIKYETNPDAIAWWSFMIQEAAKRGGRILVLTLSYNDAELIRDRLGSLPGREILFDERGAAGATVIDRFRKSPNGILVTPARWTGLDLPGLIKHIVVTRIPMSPPDVVTDAVLEAHLLRTGRSRTYLSANRMAISITRARRKVAQGIGRGIRQAGDSVTVWIGDWRWPMPDARRHGGQGVRTPDWAFGMTEAVPARFREALSAAKRFRPGIVEDFADRIDAEIDDEERVAFRPRFRRQEAG